MATRTVKKGDPLHEFLRKRVETRIKYAQSKRVDQIKKWEQAEDSALAYLPEQEVDTVRRLAREQGGAQTYTTIQIPYSYAVLMAAHTYLTSVFFSRSPVHQFAGRHGESEQQVTALEALMSYQVETGEHLVPYYIWIYDMAKYGHGVLGDYWCEETIQYSSVEEQELPVEALLDEMMPAGVLADPTIGVAPQEEAVPKKKKMQNTFQAAGFTGNRVYNVSPYDFGHDPHFPIGRFQQGEYCYVRKTIGWNEIVKRREAGYYMNTELLPAKPEATATTQQGSSQLVRPVMTGFQDGRDDEDSKHPSSVEVYEFYVELIQKEWRLGNSNYPEKWVITITSDYSLLLGVEPVGAMHGKFPFDIGQTEIEGYGLFTRGLPEVVKPLQNTMDWLINTHFYNVRAALNNQFITDPSKIVVDDAEDGGPGFIYSLRPEAYGSDVRSFFYQIQVQDMTRGHMQDLTFLQNLGEMVTGINDQMFGVLSGAGRKTATEIRTSTGFGVNRLKTAAEFVSAQAMSPLAQKLVQNSQQWYEGDLKLKIVGDLAQMAGPAFMNVDKQAISGFYDFVPVDGTLPIDRMAMATLWQTLMTNMSKIPGLLQQFDISKVFTHIAQIMGIRNINQFRVQILPDAQLAQQAAAGTSIPVGGPQKPALVRSNGAPVGVSKGSGVATPNTGAMTAGMALDGAA